MQKFEVIFVELSTGRKGSINVYGEDIIEAENTFRKNTHLKLLSIMELQ